MKKKGSCRIGELLALVFRMGSVRRWEMDSWIWVGLGLSISQMAFGTSIFNRSSEFLGCARGHGCDSEGNLCFDCFPSSEAEMALLKFGGLSVVHSMALTRNYPPNRRVFVGVPGGTITYGLVLQGPRGSWGHAGWPDSVGSAVLFVKRGMGMCQCRKTVASDAKG